MSVLGINHFDVYGGHFTKWRPFPLVMLFIALTREGEKAIYRLAKSRDQATKDNNQGYFVKAQDGTLLLNTEENISRWAEYFKDLPNKARQHIDGRDEPLTEGPLQEVTCEEVERQLNKMKNGKSCGPDGIPTEALKHLGDWGVRQLTKIFNAILQSGKMPVNGRRAPSHLSIKTREIT